MALPLTMQPTSFARAATQGAAHLATALVLLAFTLALAAAPAHATPDPAQDPLFVRMRGTWEGQGIRTQTFSGRSVRILTRTYATLKGAKLYSHNEISETPIDGQGQPSGPAKVYARAYWLRAADADLLPGLYELGIGEGADEKITSQGRFDGSILEVEQRLGGDPPLVVRSRTALAAETGEGVSIYSDTVWYGERKLNESRIQYRRLPASPRTR